MAPPSEINAVVITKPGAVEVKRVPLPNLPDDFILVRTTAVALNPTDWKHAGVGGNPLGVTAYTTGTRVGCDYAGIVEQVGSKVTKDFAPGDRVCGIVHGSNNLRPDGGSFAEYIVAKGDLQIKTPDNLSDEEAATLGVGISTVAQGLYQTLGLPLPSTANHPNTITPSNPPPEILIYGGSTATGVLGIQFAKLSGYRVATTCSPSNFDYVKSLGADAAFDYRAPDVVDAIRAWSNNADELLTIAWDCISNEASARISVAALSRTKPGHYRSLSPIPDELVKELNEKVDNGWRLAYTMFGEAIQKSIWMEAVPEDFEYGKMFWELARELLAEGKVKAVKADMNRGGKGLEGVVVGLKELAENKVSGAKLVYTL
ncbi:chaperonin 10-like protein [Dichotomopilus funicola]|uniref:Chaperonin 10-like protein n=1 Tax=Dichotomopilus funicola TaxID=1934379 RepID=A0AAN6V9L9_9PEZI|nr:chaperonin 10-like protein [Dichotomopilus funicola]